MKYRLYTEEKYSTATEQILYGRGIEDINKWLGASIEDINDWQMLDNIVEGVHLLKGVIEHDSNAVVIVDCDVDGYSSAAIIINFLYSLYPDWVDNHLSYLHHNGKEHGLADMVDKIPEGTELIICPDSASNDYEQHEYFVGKSDILILDHHEAPHVSESINTITINNQLCDYPNKDFSGAGIAWQFCRAYNYIHNLEGIWSTDLAALGNCGDMMSFKAIETKALITFGFKHIQNAFFQEMIKNNEYTLNKYGGLGYKAVAFAVVPFINATVRSGTQEEKDMVFRAMCNPWCYDLVPNTKRGHKGETWPLYQQAVYMTAAIKRRQTKAETEALEFFEKQIVENNLLDNAVLACVCGPDDVSPQVRGLIANKLASKYQHPCIVVTKNVDENGHCSYNGSLRNYSMSPIESLKFVFEETGLVDYVQGHASAAGIGISEENFDAFIQDTNDKLLSSVGESVYWVDYIWKQNDVTSNSLLELAEMAPFWGQDIPASQVCVEDIDLSQCKLTLCGQKNNTLRMILSNGIVGVRFGVTEDEFNAMLNDNTYMTCIVSPARNEWMGKVSGEMMIDTYELNTKWVF